MHSEESVNFMKSKSKTFYRYILSYALVLFLPIAVLFTLFSSFLFARYNQEIADSNARLLAQMQENLDTQLEQLVNISFMIQNNAVVNLRTNEGDVVAARKAVDTLNVLHSVSSLPDFLITYRSGTDYCFTTSSRIRPEKLFADQLAYAHHTLQDFYATIDRPESIVTWPADTVRQYGGQETEYITLFISVTGGVKTPKLRTAYLIPSSRIRSSVTRITEEYGGTVQITDPEGNLLLGIGPVTREAYLQAGEPAADGTVTPNGEKHLLSSAHSSVVGWDYTVLIPSRVIEAPMRNMRRIMILSLIIISALGATAVYYLSSLHYKPLKRLTEKALSSHASRPEDARAGRTDEMRQVEAVLDALAQESRSSRLALEESRSVLLQSGLRKLLSGGYSDSLKEELSRNGLTLSAREQYRVAVLDCEKNRLAALREEADLFMASLSFGRQDAVLCSSLPGDGCLAVLFPRAAADDGAEDSLYSLKNRLEDACGVPVSAGLSLPCPADSIGTAYTQAVRALQFRLVRGSGCLVVYSADLDTASSLQNYPREQLEQLQWYLLQRDTENVSRLLHRLLGTLQKGPVSFNFVRMVCFDVVNTTVRTLYTGRDGSPVPAFQPEMLEQLISFDTVPELIDLLERFVEDTCVSMETLQPDSGYDRLQEMKAYIEENCFDEIFSLQAMADHFSLTPSNLSHYFKGCAGQGVLEYVQSQRKKEACRLLSQTDEPVQIVGAKVGMPNVSSFIRFFKQQTGITPGQYRKQNRSEE